MSDRIKPMLLGPKEVKWTAPEFEYFPKDVSWYWLTVIIAAILIAITLWQKNFLFAIFIVVAEGLVVFWGKHRPQKAEFALNDRGLEIDQKKFYPYEDFQGFAVKDSKVILRRKSRMGSCLKLSADNQKIPEIKKLLSRFLPEIEYEESLVEHIGKLLRF